MDMEVIEKKERCPRCGQEAVEFLPRNGRGKDRKCGKCGVVWDHRDPEGSYSIIPL